MTKRMKKWAITCGLVVLSAFVTAGVACGEPKQLTTPENLQLNGRMLTWDEVKNADGYVVFVDEKEYEVEGCSFELPFLAGPKTYQVEVMALGDWKKTKDSDCGEIEYTKVVAEEKGEKDGFHFVLMEDLESYEIVQCDNKEGYVEFPDDYLDYPVKKIGVDLFGPPQENFYMGDLTTGENCNQITTGIKLPRYLEEIGKHAFSYCIALQEVVIPDSVTTIGRAAFSNCFQLQSIDIPFSLRIVESSAFANSLGGMTELIFPDGIERIGDSAFVKGELRDTNITVSSKLRKLVIPNSIKSIGTLAFTGNPHLEEIDIKTDNIEEFDSYVFRDTAWEEAQPDGIVYLDKMIYKYKGEMPEDTKLTIGADVVGIATAAFSHQENLKEVWLADGVKLLGNLIFYDTGLTKVRLPADLTCIPDYTFSDSDKIREIEIPETVMEIGKGALSCRSLVYGYGKVILHAKCKMVYDTFGTVTAGIIYQGVEYCWWTGGIKGEGYIYCYIDKQGYFTVLE